MWRKEARWSLTSCRACDLNKDHMWGVAFKAVRSVLFRRVYIDNNPAYFHQSSQFGRVVMACDSSDIGNSIHMGCLISFSVMEVHSHGLCPRGVSLNYSQTMISLLTSQSSNPTVDTIHFFAAFPSAVWRIWPAKEFVLFIHMLSWAV